MAQRFVYRASAVPFGGEIKHPFSDVLDAQASTSLSPNGGAGSARADSFRFREIVSFDAAYSQVVGSPDEKGTNETLALAVVEGLNILDMVTADRIVARLTSSQPAEASADAELPMRSLGSYFVNLRIAGIPVELPPLADVVTRTEKSQIDPKGGESSVLSILDPKDLVRLGGCATVQGALRIAIPDFGTVTLGEYIVSAHARRLTMLRAELGSPVRGWITAGAMEGNGSPI